jgi:predicted nucleic acid-binding protein
MRRLLAQTLGHTLKDCLYLALARELDCDFLTCDARFVAKAALLSPRARLLEDS